MSVDMNRCPQNEAEFRDYVYSLIGRALNTPANDWAAVWSAEYNWKGRSLRIPEGVGPGVRQTADAPFFGLTQQWSSGPKARLFLPTAMADGNGYFTRNIQYIQDAPGGGFIWSWSYIDGNAYSPVSGAVSNPPPSPSPEPVPVPLQDLTPRVEALEAEVANLGARLDTLKAVLGAVNDKFAKLVIKGNTKSRGGAFGLGSHFHEVDIPVVVSE